MFSFWRQSSSSWWWLLAALSCARASLTVQGGNVLADSSVANRRRGGGGNDFFVRSGLRARTVPHTPPCHSRGSGGAALVQMWLSVNVKSSRILIANRTVTGPTLVSNDAAAIPADQSDSDRDGPLEDESVETNEMLQPSSKPVNERFPFAVLFGPTCGGTIISPTWIITAAHCTLFTNGRYILAGTNNTRDGSGVRVKVSRKLFYPKFTMGPYWLNVDEYGIKQVAARFDFLLAELATPLSLDGKLLAAASLPHNFGPTIPPGLSVSFAGYGANNHGETMQSEMHAREFQTVADEVCARRLPEYDAQDMLCARGIPPRYDSACNGDSGSGLVHDGQLIGIMSWVEDDAISCYPGAHLVFSRISVVRDWIRATTGV